MAANIDYCVLTYHMNIYNMVITYIRYWVNCDASAQASGAGSLEDSLPPRHYDFEITY